MELEINPAIAEEDFVHADFERRFAPFIRRDVYGRFGSEDLPWKEKFLMTFALVTLVPVRSAVAFSLLVFYYFVCRVCTLFQVPNRDGTEQEDYAHMRGWRRTVIVNSGKLLARIFLFLLGFYRINEINLQPQFRGISSDESESQEQSEAHGIPGALISNHVSYIDFLYHMSSSFPSFVTERSVAELPLVSFICKCLGCIYVRREMKSNKGISGVLEKRMKRAYRNKDAPQLVLFPEGTTSNGDFLLPFKTGAFVPKVPVLPVILRYPYKRFSPAWDSVAGVCHVMYLLSQFVNYMEVIRFPVYYPSPEEMKDPKLYANNLRSLMAAEGKLKLSDIGLTQKRAYYSAVSGLYKSD